MTKRFKLEHSESFLVGVHDKACCEGRACSIHNRSDHPMRSFPQHWRGDRALMERTCPHRIGHPDPDHLSYILLAKGEKAMHAESVHGCDGCCGGAP